MHIAFKITPLIITGTIMVLLGLICDGIIIARFVPNTQFRVGPKPWGLRALAVGVLLLTVLFVLSNICYALIGALLHHKHIVQLTGIILPVELVLHIAALAGFAVYFSRQRFHFRQDLGLHTLSIGAEAEIGIAHV